MVVKKSLGDRAFDIINMLFMIFMIIITVYPFIYVILASISEARQLVGHSGLLLRPKGFSLTAYNLVFQNPNIATGYKNTLFVLVVGTFINLLLTSLGAYVLSRKNFGFRNFMMIIIVFTMYFNGGLIPRYLLIYNNYHLGNSLWALILPQAISTWNLIVMRTSFMSIPDSLEESAKIDGANDLIVLFRIVLPLSLPVVAVMILFYGVGHWNAWFDAMIFLRERELYPLQLILREILISNSNDIMLGGVTDIGDRELIGESIQYATIMVATLPILFIYPFVQKYFVKGVLVGALKG